MDTENIDKIIKQHPLSMEYETDARTIWPKRWEKLQVKFVKLQVENKELRGLLNFAICPNAMNGCKNGILISPNGETESCQWCAMTKQALKK